MLTTLGLGDKGLREGNKRKRGEKGKEEGKRGKAWEKEKRRKR